MQTLEDILVVVSVAKEFPDFKPDWYVV